MIGEIRDLETAQIAVQAALTGHMVFSTLHTNDSLSAFTRLVDMGVEPFLVASAVRLVMAQRLARRLCPRCAEPEEPPGEVEKSDRGAATTHDPSSSRICRGGGVRSAAANAFGSGFKRPAGPLRDGQCQLRRSHDAILRRASAQEMREMARRQGVRTLREDGIVKAWRAETSLDEVFRVTGGAVGL